MKLSVLALSVIAGVGVANAQATSPIPLSVHPILASSTNVGAAPSSEVLHLAISLKPSNIAGLEVFCDSVSDPTSSNYGKFLTPNQVGEKYGASSADYNAVKSYLTSKGFTVTLTAPNRMVILADATVAQAQTAFSTTIRKYTGPNPGGSGTISFRANSTSLKLPTNLVNKVIDVAGVESYTRPKPRVNTQTLTPLLTRLAYNIQPFFLNQFRGQGRTVGISNWDGFRISDAASFISQFNLPTPVGGATSNIQITKIDGGSGTGAPQGEGDLDIQMVLSTAPLANVIVYDGGGGLVNVLAKESTDNKADIITESWGWVLNGSQATAAHNQHLTMTAQGITYMAATGDFGTTLEPFSYPNYEPEVLQVGGTTITVDNITGVRASEVGWSGSGGGWSTNSASFNTRPSWQVGTGVPTNINKRLCPDISLHASGNGGAYFFFSGGGQTSGDGTSFSSPVFAGGLASAEQKLISLGKLGTIGGKLRLGRIQNLIYQQNGRPDIYRDITSGANGTLPDGSPSVCKVGWDYVTGFGVVNFDTFVNSFGSASAISIAPTSVDVVQGILIGGDLASALASDNSWFMVRSYLIDQNGNQVVGSVPPTAQAASFEADFTLDLSEGNLSSLTTVIEAKVDVSGAAGQIFAYNWTTGTYQLAASFALTTADKSTNVTIPSNLLPKFVDGLGNVRLLVRAIDSVKGGRPGKIPPQFILSVDKLSLAPVFISQP